MWAEWMILMLLNYSGNLICSYNCWSTNVYLLQLNLFKEAICQVNEGECSGNFIDNVSKLCGSAVSKEETCSIRIKYVQY